ncbi:MAG: DNA-directed RNA polymerase [Candidatus Bilamarchaeaceae archaeon]
MYYINLIEDKVRIPPTMFGSKIEDAALRILRERYEGRIFKEVGIVLSIFEPEIIGEGVVIPGDAGAYYSVKFKSLSFIPFVNEVFLAEIKDIVEFGAFASFGPFQGLIHISQIGKDKFFYDKKAKTLSAKAAKKTVKKGDLALVKVSTVSLKTTSADTKIGLTMRPDGLGLLSWVEKEEKKTEEKSKKTESKEEKK